jgi:hypothetical protein
MTHDATGAPCSPLLVGNEPAQPFERDDGAPAEAQGRDAALGHEFVGQIAADAQQLGGSGDRHTQRLELGGVNIRGTLLRGQVFV